ncbi:LOW QUALITY PROTEIN: Macrolide export ATP-binding/permease protein MacB, partial [Frankliniella fusca]
MSCGRSGYQTLQKEVPDMKLPSIRTLQRALLDDVRDRDCVAFLDEMSSKSQLDFDLGTREFIGHVTLPGGQEDLSSKTEAYICLVHDGSKLLGTTSHPTKGMPKKKKEVVFEMIRRGHEAGLNVVALACDMGNRSMLYEMGFGTQKDNIRFSIPHPADPSKKPY